MTLVVIPGRQAAGHGIDGGRRPAGGGGASPPCLAGGRLVLARCGHLVPVPRRRRTEKVMTPAWGVTPAESPRRRAFLKEEGTI